MLESRVEVEVISVDLLGERELVLGKKVNDVLLVPGLARLFICQGIGNCLLKDLAEEWAGCMLHRQRVLLPVADFP